MAFLSTDIVQVRVARHYEREHGAAYVAIGNLPKFDIQFADKTTMEVKVDIAAGKTLNAAIEFWDSRRNRPTGILATEAKLWLHCVPQGEGLRCYELDTKRLSRLCIESGVVKAGGDHNSSLLKILPLQEIQRICNVEFHLEAAFNREPMEV